MGPTGSGPWGELSWEGGARVSWASGGRGGSCHPQMRPPQGCRLELRGTPTGQGDDPSDLGVPRAGRSPPSSLSPPTPALAPRQGNYSSAVRPKNTCPGGRGWRGEEPAGASAALPSGWAVPTALTPTSFGPSSISLGHASPSLSLTVVLLAVDHLLAPRPSFL